MTKWILVSVVLIVSIFYFFNKSLPYSEKPLKVFPFFESHSEARSAIASAIEKHLLYNQRPDKIEIADESLDVEYSFDSDLQNQANKILKRYKPDYGAVIVMNAETGQILTMSSYVRADEQATNLNLKATFPAASVFKIITAATAVDRKGVDPHDKIAFNGGNHTLYKKNVLSETVNKWTRFISLKDAFAKSINTAFGRLTLENLDPHDLSEYARRFMFNKYIPADFNIQTSQAFIPDEKGFKLTQVAAGYNRYNTLSPVHGAMIAASIINDGQVVAPYIVSELSQNSKVIYTAEPYIIGQAITKDSAAKVQEMMKQTVLSGTSRKTFKQILKDKKFKEVSMGGKTGHFSGLNPKGRNDWFVGYATDGDTKIAIAAITVNIQKWTIKSSSLAEMLFRHYFKSILEEKEISKKLIQQQRDSDQTQFVDPKFDKI